MDRQAAKQSQGRQASTAKDASHPAMVDGRLRDEPWPGVLLLLLLVLVLARALAVLEHEDEHE